MRLLFTIRDVFWLRRAVVVMALLAAIHLALTWYTVSEAFAHGLERGIAARFGSVIPSDTGLDNFVAVTSTILLLPVGLVFNWLPPTTGNDPADRVLFWTLLVLNSLLCGATLYYGARKINSLIWHMPAGR